MMNRSITAPKLMVTLRGKKYKTQPYPTITHIITTINNPFKLE